MKLEDIDWYKIQKFYDDNNTWSDIMVHFKITSYFISKALKLNLIKIRSKSEANKLGHIKKPQKHTDETKKKISEIRKKYLLEHPDKVPYLLNHNSKGESYPEKYFDSIFKKEKDLNYERYFQFSIYQMDFCFTNKKIDLEIDGGQHYDDKRIVESDKKRDEFMKIHGWKTIRVDWRKYQKFNSDEKISFIKNLIEYIKNENNQEFIPLYKIEEQKIIKRKKSNRKKFLCECGNPIHVKGKSCIDCSRKKRRKINRPDIQVLLKDINDIGYVKTGKKYGVSDNCIRKWIK